MPAIEQTEPPIFETLALCFVRWVTMPSAAILFLPKPFCDIGQDKFVLHRPLSKWCLTYTSNYAKVTNGALHIKCTWNHSRLALPSVYSICRGAPDSSFSTPVLSHRVIFIPLTRIWYCPDQFVLPIVWTNCMFWLVNIFSKAWISPP